MQIYCKQSRKEKKNTVTNPVTKMTAGHPDVYTKLSFSLTNPTITMAMARTKNSNTLVVRLLHKQKVIGLDGQTVFNA